MVRYITFFIFLSLSISASTSFNAHVDHQYIAIKTLQPKLSEVSAYKLANALKKGQKECGIPWQILLSIAFNESSLIKTSVNKKTLDFGLYQLSINMIKRLNLDVYSLLSDEAYSVSAACSILKYNKDRFSKHYPYWIGIYRSGTALWKKDIRQNAISYDKIIRQTAYKIGYRNERH